MPQWLRLSDHWHSHKLRFKPSACRTGYFHGHGSWVSVLEDQTGLNLGEADPHPLHAGHPIFHWRLLHSGHDHRSSDLGNLAILRSSRCTHLCSTGGFSFDRYARHIMVFRILVDCQSDNNNLAFTPKLCCNLYLSSCELSNLLSAIKIYT